MDKNLDRISELTGMLRATNKRLAGLEHEARQSRLATEAGVEPDAKTRKCTKGASAADRAMNVDSSPARVNYGPTRLTIFGMIAEPPAPEKSIGNALVDKGAEARKLCLSPGEMRTPTAVGGLVPAGTTSTAMRTIFLSSPRWSFCPTEEMNFRTTTSIQTYTMYISFWQMNVLKTRPRQTLVFDHGGCKGRLHVCPFQGGWHTLLCGELSFGRRMVSEAGACI